MPLRKSSADILLKCAFIKKIFFYSFSSNFEKKKNDKKLKRTVR